MKIALVVTNSKRKSLAFVSNALEAYSLEEAIQLTREGKIEGAHVVRSNKGTCLRTNPSVAKSIDLTKRPEIIATLYPQGLGDPKTNPQPVPRGSQIAKEFYQLAKKWL